MSKDSDLDILINGASILDANNGIALKDLFESEPSIDIGENLDGYAYGFRLHNEDRINHDDRLIR